MTNWDKHFEDKLTREQSELKALKLAKWTLRTAPEVVDGSVKDYVAQDEVQMIVKGFERDFSDTAKHALAVYEAAMAMFVSGELTPSDVPIKREVLDATLAMIEARLAVAS